MQLDPASEPNPSTEGAIAPADRKDEPTRREVARSAVKLIFVAPVLSTFFAHEAYAANYSCYPQNHACIGAGNFEPCCPGLVCSGGFGPGTCQTE